MAEVETFAFQAEINQLLSLIINVRKKELELVLLFVYGLCKLSNKVESHANCPNFARNCLTIFVVDFLFQQRNLSS